MDQPLEGYRCPPLSALCLEVFGNPGTASLDLSVSAAVRTILVGKKDPVISLSASSTVCSAPAYLKVSGTLDQSP